MKVFKYKNLGLEQCKKTNKRMTDNEKMLLTVLCAAILCNLIADYQIILK